jgi:hypothetical protein
MPTHQQQQQDQQRAARRLRAKKAWEINRKLGKGIAGASDAQLTEWGRKGAIMRWIRWREAREEGS